MKKTLLLLSMMTLAVLANAQFFGCMDPSADNYDPSATQDDGSCTFTVYGCTDPSADNYDPSVTQSDGSCMYTIYGCTDPSADNYDPSATQTDGSCTYTIPGCTDPQADNYSASATVDDGSCEYRGCTDPTASNYDAMANVDDGSCDVVSGINTFENSVISIFPNPTSSRMVNVSGDVDHVVINNMTGLQVGDISVENKSIDLGNLENGTYTLMLFNDGEVVSTQIVTKK